LENIIDADVPEDGVSIVYTSADMIKLFHSRSFFNTFRLDKIIDETNITDADILCRKEGGLETTNVGNNRFRVKIEMNKYSFVKGDKEAQENIVKSIISIVCQGTKVR